jgi:hypothetical protein
VEAERGSSGSRLHQVESDYKHGYKRKNFIKGGEFFQLSDLYQENNALFHYLEWDIISSSIDTIYIK